MKMSAARNFLEDRLGALPSPPDPRHYRVRSPILAEAEELPEEYDGLLEFHDLENWYDQGSVGSCCGWDGSIVMEVTGHLMDMKPEDLSAGWLYMKSREYANIPPHIEGSTNLGLMKALQKVGATTEECAPTDTSKPFEIKPCGNAMEIAKSYMIDSYWMGNTVPVDMQAAIYGLTHPAPYKMPDGSPGKIPLVTAYPVYESFYDARNDGRVPLPVPGEKLLGGHSSMVRGWKIIDGEKYFINTNSWGSDWGIDGTNYLPFGYPFYDAWVIHNGPYTPPPDPDPYQPSTCVVARGYAGLGSGLSNALGRKSRFKAVIP